MSKDESNEDEDLDLKALLRKLEENDQKEDKNLELKLEKLSMVRKPAPKTSTAEALLGALETLAVSEEEPVEAHTDNSISAVSSKEITDSMDESEEEVDPFPPGIVHAIRVIQTEFDLFETDELDWED
ncbi:MAG: hypothetical protein ACFFC7_17405 [Candidatus Hermodarchaeota archaeon]